MATTLAGSGARETAERALGADPLQVRPPDAVVGELLLGPQRRLDRAALGLEVRLGDGRLHGAAEHVARAAAVAELRLRAPQQVVRQPAVERLAQQRLLRP